MSQGVLIETGLHPKNVFDAVFKHEVDSSQRYDTPLTLLKLKPVFGDLSEEVVESAVLTMTTVLKFRLRATDVPTFNNRGLFFYILLSHTNAAGARVVCERVLEIIKSLEKYETISGIPFELLANIGMTSSNGGKELSATQLFTEVDLALVEAQKQGKQNFVEYQHIEKD